MHVQPLATRGGAAAAAGGAAAPLTPPLPASLPNTPVMMKL